MLNNPLVELTPTQFIAAAATSYYTSPFAANTNGIVLVTGFVLCNTDTSPWTVTIHNVPSGGSASAGNKVVAEASLPANTTWFKNRSDGLWVIPAGGFIQALASSADKITITLYGKEIS